MLSFNPILSQSTATQSLKNFRRRLIPLTPPLGRSTPQLYWCSLRSQMSDQVLIPYLQHCKVSKIMLKFMFT